MTTFNELGPRISAYQSAMEEFQKAHRDELARVEGDLKRIVEKAKAEAADVTIPQYKLQCLSMSGGDIGKASEMFAFIMGGDK